MTNTSFRRRLGACAAMLAALGLAACKSDSGGTTASAPSQTVTVVGMNTTESHIVTEIYAQALEKSGFRVARRSPVADLAAGYASLTGGAADVFITHTNDLLTYLVQANPEAAASTSTTDLNTTTSAAEPTTVLETTTTAAASTTSAATATTVGVPQVTTTTSAESTSTTSPVPQVGQAAAVSINLQSNQIGEILPDTLQIGAASNAENKNVIACNGIVSAAMSLVNLSQVSRFAGTLRIAGTADFETGTPFGLPGFEDKYGGVFKEFVKVDPGQVGDAISPPAPDPSESTTTTVPTSDAATTTTVAAPPDIDAECGAFNSLDVTIPDDAVVMDDDQNWITTNGVIPLLTAKAYSPGASQIIDQVSQTLHTTDLRTMVKQVDVDKVDVNVVAANFLSQAGIGG
ncbi:MAG TPA: glycine betaine ABC transporter substrate-binding protein [Ilumatobacteraceae bacterium]|nr:glycine betaine ABC transporter substrate-binding protein [Ilumatobacteraceae bacterium]